MGEKLIKWMPVAKEVVLILLALTGLYFGLKADNAAVSAQLNKHEALQVISESAQNSRIERLERIAERQDDVIRALDRLVARMDPKP